MLRGKVSGGRGEAQGDEMAAERKAVAASTPTPAGAPPLIHHMSRHRREAGGVKSGTAFGAGRPRRRSGKRLAQPFHTTWTILVGPEHRGHGHGCGARAFTSGPREGGFDLRKAPSSWQVGLDETRRAP